MNMRKFTRLHFRNPRTTNDTSKELGNDICLHCRGSGYEPHMMGTPCKVCNGTGRIEI